MEFKDHAGPVYALHRVFTLNDVDWPQLDRFDDESESAALEESRRPISMNRDRAV